MIRNFFYSFLILGVAVFFSLPVFAATPRPIKFPIVSGLTGRSIGGTVVVSWGKPSKTVKTFDGYTVFRSEQPGKLGQDSAHLSKDKQSFSDKKVIPGHTYYYSVRYYSQQPFIPANGRQIKIKVGVPVVKKSASPVATKTASPSKSTSNSNQKSAAVNQSPSSSASSLGVSTPAGAQQSNDAANNFSSPAAIPATEQPNIFSNSAPTVTPVTDANASPNDIQRLTTLKQLQIALASYFSAQNNYPSGNGIIIGATQANCLNSDGWGVSENCPYPYFINIPRDPGNSIYLYNASAGAYTITDTLQGAVSGLSGAIVATPNGIAKK